MLFNRMKATEAIEQERLQRWNDYQTYLEVEKSAELKTYLALKEKVESKPFLENKRTIESLRFKGSPEEKMLLSFQKMSRNRKLDAYFTTAGSPHLERYESIVKSGVLKRLGELEKYMQGGHYKQALNAFKQRKKRDKAFEGVWEQSDDFAKKKEYDELSATADVLFARTYAKSKAYKNYLSIHDSAYLNQYLSLKKEVESEKFITRKTYLENLKRFEETEDYQELKQFESLDKNAGIKLYMQYNNTDAFRFYRKWLPTFHENFASFDKNIWKFLSPLAENGPGKNFSIGNQLHYANNSDNFKNENSIFTLETKKQNAEGLYWDSQFGFVPKHFAYTSGVMHSIDGFMQQYGMFEVKVKASKVKGVVSSISLVSADEEICIRLFTSSNGKASGGLVITNHQNKHFEAVPLKTPSRGYLIIELHWTRDKLEWKVNERKMGTLTSNIPLVPLGLRIESEVLRETNNLPHRLDIDWIKCYKSGN